MTVKTIALGILSAAEAEWLVPLACDLARGLGAHLTGVHPTETLTPFVASAAAYPVVIEPVHLDWQVAETDAIRTIFETQTRSETFGAEFRGQAAGAVGAEAFLLETLRSADLVVLGRGDPAAMRSDDIRLQERAIRDAGRPVLMLPAGHGITRPAERLLVGWSGTREAARAAHDVLALAAPGASIDLLRVHGSIRSPDLEIDSRQDLAAALDRLGYRADLVDRDAPAGETGEVLLQVALERGAEVVATGAFGHSRSYDFVIGAATRYLLGHAGVPVLLSK